MMHCEAGHTKHNRKVVKTTIGDMTIFDWEQYMDFAGYCAGQDGVSQTIDKAGYWDLAVQDRVLEILRHGKGGLVFDVGCHIGYFSRIALASGYNVKAFDGEDENLELARLNAQGAEFYNVWFDESVKNDFIGMPERVKLMKIDIEGNEQFAIKFFEKYLPVTENIIMEVSPVFNNSYPALVEKLRGFGFDVFELNGLPFDFNWDFEQKDLWFKKV